MASCLRVYCTFCYVSDLCAVDYGRNFGVTGGIMRINSMEIVGKKWQNTRPEIISYFESMYLKLIDGPKFSCFSSHIHFLFCFCGSFSVARSIAFHWLVHLFCVCRCRSLALYVRDESCSGIMNCRVMSPLVETKNKVQ